MKRNGSHGAKLVEVIEVRVAVGQGTEKDPNRITTEYWSKEGKLLAVADPFTEGLEFPALLDQ